MRTVAFATVWCFVFFGCVHTALNPEYWARKNIFTLRLLDHYRSAVLLYFRSISVCTALALLFILYFGFVP